MLLLTITQGPDRGKAFNLPNNEPQLIGRSSEALRITDFTVSRRHAELTPDSGHWYIRDLQSHNGTYVNGVRINKRTKLKIGDEIRAGSTVFAFGGVVSHPESDIVEILRPEEIDAEIEHALASNEDSVLMAEPEPRIAANEHLRLLFKASEIATESIDKQELLASILELVFDQFEPERGVILIAPDKYHSPRPVVVKYMTPPKGAEEAKIQLSQTILQHAIVKKQSVLSSNAMAGTVSVSDWGRLMR